MVSERELLERYALVGGPDEMIPRLKRVAKALAENAVVREEYERETFALFEKTPGENIEKWTSVPAAELGDDVGAFNMAVALASVPKVAATHAKFGLPSDHLAKTFSWFRAMIDLYERLPSLKYNPDEPSGLFFCYDLERCDPRDYPVTNSLERAYVTIYERGELPCDGCAWVKVSDAGEVLWHG